MRAAIRAERRTAYKLSGVIARVVCGFSATHTTKVFVLGAQATYIARISASPAPRFIEGACRASSVSVAHFVSPCFGAADSIALQTLAADSPTSIDGVLMWSLRWAAAASNIATVGSFGTACQPS